ncbi:unnamed protein product [Urochloa humidicola]
MAPEANGGDDGNGGCSAMKAAENKKPRKRKKSRSSSSSAGSRSRSGTSSSSLPTDGDGNGGGGQQRQPPVVVVQQQQQLHRGKPRVVWTTQLHGEFLKACDSLGKDAVPKKILALMNVDGISREHVASHLQKHRLNLKREEQRLQRVPGRGDERPPLQAETSSQTPLPSLHPPDQAPAASSSLHRLPPPQPPFASLTMSGLQIAEHAQQQLLHQTPPPDSFTSSSSAPTNLFLHPHPGFPMVQPIQQCFTPPLQATIAMPPNTLVNRLQAGHNNATMQQAAAAASGHNPMRFVRSMAAQPLARAPQMQAPQVVGVTEESSVREANSVNDEETEIRSLADLLMAVEAEDGQGRPAERGAASEMATTRVEEGQGQAAEPGAAETAAAKAEEGQGGAAEPGAAPAAAASSLSPAGTSIHGEYWKIDDTDVSWDFSGFHDWCKSD